MYYPGLLQCCCIHTPNTTDPASLGQFLFVSTTLMICSVTFSIVSLVGVCYLLIPRHASDIDDAARHTRVLTGPTLKKFITPLLTADILGTAGILVRSVIWLLALEGQPGLIGGKMSIFCIFNNVWIAYFFLCSFCWNMIHALELLRSMSQHQEYYLSRHFLGWMVPAVLASAAGVLMYYPALDRCPEHGSWSVHIAFVMLMVPMAMVFLINPILFFLACKAARRLLIRSGRFTGNEREVLEAVNLKCILIMVVFLVCWFPNIAVAFLDNIGKANSKRQVLKALWVIMAITNPMQALLNCLALRGWPGFLTKCAADACRPCCPARNDGTALNVNSERQHNTETHFLSPSSSESEPILSFRRNPVVYT